MRFDNKGYLLVLMVLDMILAAFFVASGSLGWALGMGLCAFYWWLRLEGEI